MLPLVEEISSSNIFFFNTLEALKEQVSILYNEAFDKLKTQNRFHAAMGAFISVLICLGGVLLTVFTGGAAAYFGKALIQTGVSGFTYCLQAAI